jgi:uncharacterized protein DUF6317
MGDGIEVVFEDILRMSAVFESQGAEYDAIVPKEIRPIPEVREGSLEGALSTTLDAIAVMHDSIGASMKSYGGKLRVVHDRYRDNEDNAIELLRSIDDPEKIQPKF